MDWLKNFWDKYSWLLFLPKILAIGVVIILAIVAIRFGVIYVFQNVPFSVWGSFLGSTFLLVFGWYLLDKIYKNKGLDWNLAAQISSISLIFGAIGLIILSASIIWFLLPKTANSFWEIAQIAGFFLIVSLVCYAFIFVCGEFIAQGIILMRRGFFSGSFLILIALFGIAPIFLKLYDLLYQNYVIQNWISAGFFSFLFMLIAGFIIIYSIIPAFRVDKFSLEENKKDEPI